MKQLPNVNALTNDKFVGPMLETSSSSSPTLSEQPVPDNRIRIGTDLFSRERLVNRMFKNDESAYDALVHFWARASKRTRRCVRWSR